MKILLSVSAATVVLLPAVHAAFPTSVSSLMDTTADPCDDFYQYACGNWVKNFTLPDDRGNFEYSWSSVYERGINVIQDIVKEDWPIVGELWDSCMALDAMSALGNKPLQKDLSRIAATSSKKDLSKLAGELGTIGPSLITGPSIGIDYFNAKIYALYAGSPYSVLPNWSFYRDEQNFAGLETAFRRYISTIVKLAGINSNPNGQQGQQGGSVSVDTKYIEDLVIDFEKKLAFIQVLEVENGPHSVTYSEAAVKWPLTFESMTKGFGLLEKSPFTVDSIVYVDSTQFMDRAEKLFSDANLKDLKLYYSFLYANAYARYLGDAFVQARFEFFDQFLSGLAARAPRVRACSFYQTDILPDLIGKYYFLKMFDTDREKNVQAMVDAVEVTMEDHLSKVTWLDEATRQAAKQKLSKVTNLIGHSTQKKSYPFVLTRDNFFENVQTIWTANWNKNLARLLQPVDHTEWAISAATVNAFYYPLENKMVFSAAILQPPFYNVSSHPAQKFGAIGQLIGHELTHGFDSSGRHFDGDGNRREWWTPTSADEFEKRATCLKEQYNAFPVVGDGGKIIGHVDGYNTITENIADNGGLSLAFDAYHSWLKSAPAFDKTGVTDDEADKLFFVSFGQNWCVKIRDEFQKQLLVTDVHSPDPWRVNGVAMNSVNFAKTFQCKVGSKMNPEKKCELWQT